MSEENKNIEEQQPEEIISSEQSTVPVTEEQTSYITDQTSYIQDMEVHKHPHHVTHKKKWGEYFLEFLMLFLAVFLGFFAENLREHQVEKERESQYMESLLEDLHRDTAGIQSVYELGSQQKFLMDTLLGSINTDTPAADNIMQLYLGNANTTRIVNLDFENRTASQLKNAGGMRLIRKKNVVDSILVYWRFIETCQTVSARLERIGENRFYVSTRLFDNKYYIPGNGRYVPVSGIRDGAILVSNDPVLMAEYSNLTFAKKVVLNNYLLRMQEVKDIAVRLMDMIRKEYQLES